MSPGELDLNLLTLLNALLQERHVSRAAERARVSEPTMSRALRRLRRIFSDELLVRVGRNYQLTALGERLIEPVQDILERVSETLDLRPTFDPATSERQFTIAAAEYGAFLVLRPLSRRIVTEAPGVSIRVAPLTKRTFNDLEDGRLDLALVRRPSDCRMPGEDLFVDEYLCAVWDKNPEVGDTLTLEQYLELPHVSYSLEPGAPEEVSTTLSEAHSRRRTVTIGSHFMLPFYLEGTPLVAMVPARTGALLKDFVHIRLLKPPFEIPQVRLAMSWHPRSDEDPGHGWLRNHIRAVVAEL